MSRWLIFTFFAVSVLGSSIPTRSCLDECVCEQDESTPLIRCENGERTEIALPNEIMSGYEILAIPCNNLEKLPAAEILLAVFPDLKAIDVEGNPNLKCSEVTRLSEHIVVNSDCGKPPSQHYVCKKIDDDSCDWKCRSLKKILQLWEKLKDKLAGLKKSVGQTISDMNLEEKAKDVGLWFHSTFNKLKTAAADIVQQ